MTIVISYPRLLGALLPSLISMLAGQTPAQTFTTLRSFTAQATSSPYTNTDGARPSAALLLLSNTVYGTTKNGGRWGNGTVFAMNTAATAFTNLHSFSATLGGSLANIANTDGANPQCDLILSGNRLYGTTPYGGTNGNGTVFAINIDGTGFTNLYTFTEGSGSFPFITNSDGASPYGGLVLSGNTLFGTTTQGGSFGDGTVFAVNTDGTGFTNLHSFTSKSGSSFANSDGASPSGALVLSSNTLYGTAGGGGSSGHGTVFAINTDGTTFTNLHSFNIKEGAGPFAGLILSGNRLYGTTQNSGPLGYGSVFAVNTDGTSFTNLHSFNGSDGWEPQGKLILSGNTLYGTATYGGIVPLNGVYGNGTLFAVNTDGTGFTNLHRFTATVGSEDGYGTNSDGRYPVGGLILVGNILFGMTQIGGNSGSGTIFSLFLPPPQQLSAGYAYADFTTPMIQTSNMTITPGAYFTYNTNYGGSWDIAAVSFGFGGTFAVPNNGTYLLTVNHQSSSAATCPGGGYSPVDIYINGVEIASNFDPAQQNSGSLGKVTNSWIISASAGADNTLEWAAGPLCSRYWIYGIQITPTLSPTLTIIPSPTNVVLTWPNNAPGFTLQSATNLESPVWTTNSLVPVVVNGQNTMTNPISGARQFFRLAQ